MTDLVGLHLQEPNAANAADPTWKPAVLQILRVVCDAGPDGRSKATTALNSRLLEHRRILGGALHPQEERQETADAVTTCEKYLRQIHEDQATRERELSEMITLLREATVRILGEATEFNDTVQSSADRFKQINRIDDLGELRRELSSQVSTLEHAVEQKKQRDHAAMAQLSERVEVLQAGLATAEEKATTDPLTKVANRDGFDRALTRMIDNARRAGSPLALGMVDIDHFKQINDTWGHQVGDRVLLCCAEWLRSSVRQTDVVARYGGEEFAVLLPGANLQQSEDRFQAVLQQIASHAYTYEEDGESRTVRFTVSCGVAELTEADTDKQLVKRADQALYDAKAKGRNRVVARKVSRLARLLSRG